MRSSPNGIGTVCVSKKMTLSQEQSSATLYICYKFGQLNGIRSVESKKSHGLILHIQLHPIRNGISYVRQHYSDNISLQDLAGTAGYSIYYFCKLFKEIIKMSPMQYVVRYRIERAGQKPLISDSSVGAVMLEAGFHNYGYF